MSNALLTLFVLSTIDGWNDIMSIAANSDLSKNVIINIYDIYLKKNKKIN